MIGVAAISWMLDVIQNLPDVLTYIVPGYIFVFIYRYILYKDDDSAEHISYVVWNSIVISFILRVIFDAVVPFASTSYRCLLLIIFASAGGYFGAKMIPSKFARTVRCFLGITRTSHKNIWDDILEPGLWLRVWLKDSGKSYLGQVRYIEDYAREPIMVLERYQFLDDDAKPLFDHSADAKRAVVINLSAFERIEIVSAN